MKTLLVLEDEPLVMTLMRHILKQYSLIESTSAEHAIQLFSDRGGRIDLLIADVTLHISTGIQVALRFRSEIPDLPVILTSGYPVSAWSSRDSADLGRLGSSSLAIVQKPFQSKVLLNQVYDFIGEANPDRARTA